MDNMTTNYEKIKNMTVDEMAEFMDYINTQTACDKYCIYKDETSCVCKEDDCKTVLKQWLLSEAE